MIWQIVRKEILENVVSFRFFLALVLVVILFAAGSLVFLSQYRQQSSDYWDRTNENLSALRDCARSLYRVAFQKQRVWRQPRPLTLCAEGYERSLPNWFAFDIFTADLPDIRGGTNFTLSHFSSLDWVFIVSMILSFLALVFTYDSVSGEKEDGTLRQILASTTPRHEVLLGKYLGVMVTIGIPLCLGVLISLLIVVGSGVAFFSALDWLKIFLIVLLSVLYLSIFVLLGICVSSRTASPANSMVVLLLIWVVLAILIPSFGRIICDVSGTAPNPVELERRLAEISAEVWEKSERYGERAGYMSHNPDDPANNPPARGRLRTAEVEAKNHAREDHHNKMLAQAAVGRQLTCLSPTVVYRRASEAMVGTGIAHCVGLYRQIKTHQAALREYIRGRDAEDPGSLHLIFPDRGCAQSWTTISHRPVPFETVPKFQERALALGASLKLAIWDIGLLILFNLVFFAAAFVSFLHYDVR